MEKVILVTIVVVLLAFHLITDELDRRRERRGKTQELEGILDRMRAQDHELGKSEVASVR
jgi:hypothetical protein